MRDRPEHLDRVLDGTLALVGADKPPMSDIARDYGQWRLRARIAERPVRRPAHRWPAVVAAAATVAVAGLLLPTGGPDGATAEATEALTTAAGLADAAVDAAPGADGYRYVRSHYQGITVVHPTGTAYSSGLVIERWIPADPRDEWLERQVDDGPAAWLPGLAGPGVPLLVHSRNGEFRAPCGKFAYLNGVDRCARGSWSNPLPEFLASLPTDPDALYRRLREDAPSRTDAAVLRLAEETLSSGLAPARVRAALFRAFAEVPGLRITQRQANLDGRVGVALGVRSGGDDHEVIVDPTDGTYIGSRDVVAEDDGVLTAGAVRQFRATTTGTASWAGTRPWPSEEDR